MGGVGDVDQVIGIGVQVCAQCGAGLSEQGIVFAAKKKHRLAFKTALPVLISFKNRNRAGSEGTVIEKMNLRIKQEVLFEFIHTHYYSNLSPMFVLISSRAWQDVRTWIEVALADFENMNIISFEIIIIREYQQE